MFKPIRRLIENTREAWSHDMTQFRLCFFFSRFVLFSKKNLTVEQFELELEYINWRQKDQRSRRK